MQTQIRLGSLGKDLLSIGKSKAEELLKKYPEIKNQQPKDIQKK